MVCRHSKGDPDCSSTSEADRVLYYRRKAGLPETPETPDIANFEITDMHRERSAVVLRVRYPNCQKCAFEGEKVMVFFGVQELDVLRWKQIDPHFRDPELKTALTDAPTPAARFPATSEGWDDAIVYVQRKTGAV